MKKLYLAILMVCAILTSCDMDKRPWGALDDETAIQSVDDAFRYRNGFYIGLKAVGAGGYLAYSDIQMDQFMGVISNGNRVGTFSNGLLDSGTSEFASVWAAEYSRINSVNYIVPKYEAMIESGDFDEADVIELKRYLGEAKFARAYHYWLLLDKYCENYSKVGGSTAAKGLPLVTEYNPTGDTSKYPGRSTQDETYALIEQDLNEALAALKEYENSGVKDCRANLAPMASYLSSWAVVAMQARLALLKGDNQTAYNKAVEVIESGVYSLATLDNYIDMWTYDESDEIIFRPYCSKTELPSSTGSYYLGSDKKSADYIPTEATLFAYPADDVRWESFFSPMYIEVQGGMYGCYVFSKFGGNPDLQLTATPNFMHYPKIFRLSEMYLIAAEAGVSVNLDGANKYLNDFMEQRHYEYERGNYSASNLTNTVRSERYLEFIGEGMRQSDLRRWNQGFTREVSYDVVNPSLTYVLVSLGNITYNNDDHRFVWPIPSDEIESNPQLVGQQNPGY